MWGAHKSNNDALFLHPSMIFWWVAGLSLLSHIAKWQKIYGKIIEVLSTCLLEAMKLTVVTMPLHSFILSANTSFSCDGASIT